MIAIPDEPGPGRVAAGSSPEPLEPPHPAPPSPAPPGALEPQTTIYMREWLQARGGANGDQSDARHIFVSLMDHLETGWKHIRPLQLWYEENRETARGTDAYWHLMEFIDADLVDVFRGLVALAYALVPGYPEWLETADPGDVDGEADTFHRYLVMAGAAAEHDSVPDGLRHLARAAAHALADWTTDLLVLVDAIDRQVLTPMMRAANAG